MNRLCAIITLWAVLLAAHAASFTTPCGSAEAVSGIACPANTDTLRAHTEASESLSAPRLQLLQEPYFTPRDTDVPINCMILNAKVCNTGGTYRGRLVARMYDESCWFCDGALMDTADVVIPAGDTLTIKMHGTYQPDKDFSLSRIRFVSVYDLTGGQYLQPMTLNRHQFSYGPKDLSVSWQPDNIVATINSQNAWVNVDFLLEGRKVSVSGSSLPGSISVYNAEGQLVLRQYATGSIDLSPLRKGVYVVVAQTARGSRAAKVVR